MSTGASRGTPAAHAEYMREYRRLRRLELILDRAFRARALGYRIELKKRAGRTRLVGLIAASATQSRPK
jgi:hypothetical protein